MLEKMRNFLEELGGAGTAVAGLCMMVILGVAALVVDIGHLATVKGELQRAADAGSMAGARALWPMALPLITNPPAGPDCYSAKGVALSTATSANNQVDGEVLTTANLTIEVGNYDYATRVFTPRSDCPLTTNAVKVTAQKDVNTIFFASIWNLTSMQPAATATGTMSFAKAVGKGTIPIAINKIYVVPGAQVYINFSPDQQDNGGWFADPPDKIGAKTFKDYIINASCPPLQVGDIISLQNGEDATCFDALKNEKLKRGEFWDTFLPVVNTDQFNHPEPIIAFVPFRITQVVDTGSAKGITGQAIGLAECGRGPARLRRQLRRPGPPKAVN